MLLEVEGRMVGVEVPLELVVPREEGVFRCLDGYGLGIALVVCSCDRSRAAIKGIPEQKRFAHVPLNLRQGEGSSL